MEASRFAQFLQRAVGGVANGRLQGIGRLPLDEEFPASASGLGSDRTGAGSQREHLANPSCRNAEPLGDLFLCAFGRVHSGQNTRPKVLGIRNHDRRPTS
jgi:hypothetical protein